MPNPSGKSSSRARSAGRARSGAAARARRQQSSPSRVVWIGVAIVVVIAIALGIALAAGGGSKSSATRSPAPADLVTKVTSVPQNVLEQVGLGNAKPPSKISAPALTKDGKPEVLYVGAEYCPYCAAERWAMVQALSRFGTFSNLQLTESSSVDVLANTKTFSFYGSTYQSPYLSFSPVETATNKLSGGTYGKLETLTPEQEQIVNTYDAPPYVQGSGGIPFVDLGGKFVISGASYDASVLQGKSYDEIASALADPSSPVSKGVIGAANAITASLCTLTNNQPASACSVNAVKSIQQSLG